MLLIGLDAADWQMITPLLDAGQMPNLARFVESGVMGNMASLQPMLSPMLWTSVATGKRPYKHGIHGFVEPDPLGESLRSVTSTSRTTKALWNILSQSGLRTNVVCWYAGHPVEPIRGVAVSEHFPKAVGPIDAPWPIAPGMVHPTDLNETLAHLRIHPQEIDGYSLLPFVPQAAAIDQRKDERLGLLAKDLAECVSIQAVTTWLMENTEWDLFATYFCTIDHLSHKFMHFHPPRMSSVPAGDFELYREVMAETYRFHDVLLGRMFELAGEDTAVIVCSDHGYLNNHLRPPFTPNLPSGPAQWHRPNGILAIRGPGILQDERIYGASLLDIAPTVLHLLGLPVGADMDGNVLAHAFAEPPECIPTVPSWDEIAGESGQHSPDACHAVWDAAVAFDQLVALGYVAPRSETVEVDIQKAARENQYNLAVALIDGGKVAAAVPLLEKLYEESPENWLFGLHLASVYQRQGRVQDARRTAETIIARSQDRTSAAFGRPRTSDQLAAEPEGPRFVPHAELLLGMLDLDEGNPEAAMEHLVRAQQSGNAPPDTYTVIGRTWTRLRRWPEALSAFQQALAINPDDPRAQVGMAEALLGLRRNQEAAEYAMEAIGQRHRFPAAHFMLGVALFRLRELDGSRRAFEQCVQLEAKRNSAAVRWLRRLKGIEARLAVV